MNIFIDESGSFTGRQGEHSVSAVGALVIPDSKRSAVEKRYARLRADLPTDKGEVKGRLLSETDVDAVVSILARGDVLFEVTAIDMGVQEEDDVADHKRRQAELITKRVTDKYHPNLRAQLFDLRRRLEKMPPQLYAQSVVTFELIATVIEHSTLFYCQRMPAELAAFHWVIDGKGKSQTTDWESWWSLVVMPIVQSRTLKRPMAMLEVGDYSHFERFRASTPEHLRPHIRRIPKGRRNDATDLRKLITESFRFSSDSEPGLEMVDILVNATRRALMGNLGPGGWRHIPRLMIHRPQHYIEMRAVAKLRPPSREWPYAAVLRHFSQGGKDMIAPRFRQQLQPRMTP